MKKSKLEKRYFLWEAPTSEWKEVTPEKFEETREVNPETPYMITEYPA